MIGSGSKKHSQQKDGAVDADWVADALRGHTESHIASKSSTGSPTRSQGNTSKEHKSPG